MDMMKLEVFAYRVVHPSSERLFNKYMFHMYQLGDSERGFKALRETLPLLQAPSADLQL